MNDPQIEQGVIDSFCRLMRCYGAFKNAQWESFSVGGQDRNVASDYIFTDSTDFCLIEFKDRRSLLRAEKTKKIARAFCESAQKDDKFRQLSKECHHIAWQEGDDVRSAPYVDVVCCQEKFSEQTSVENASHFMNELSSSDFCSGFSSPPPKVKVEASRFEQYLNSLMSLSGKSAQDLVVVADNVEWPDANAAANAPPRLVVKRLKGLQAVNEWVQGKRPNSSPRDRHRPR